MGVPSRKSTNNSSEEKDEEDPEEDPLWKNPGSDASATVVVREAKSNSVQPLRTDFRTDHFETPEQWTKHFLGDVDVDAIKKAIKKGPVIFMGGRAAGANFNQERPGPDKPATFKDLVNGKAP